MIGRLFFFLSFLCLSLFANAEQAKIHYELTHDPIDAVIVAHRKDKETLDYCINGIRENCSKVRRIIVVSAEKLTNQAEWFNENLFPFSVDDIYLAIGKGDKKSSQAFFQNHNRGPGWYLQQLLKLYSPFIIPKISSNVLIVDADVVFLNPVKFLNKQKGGLFCVNHNKAKPLYLQHAERLVPGYQRIYPEVYSVCHHMLFQRPILEDLFNTVEQYHGTEFWVAFCSCVVPNPKKGASEYEIYYNFALTHTDQVALRELKWMNSAHPELRKEYEKEGYHFVGFHTYLRKNRKKKIEEDKKTNYCLSNDLLHEYTPPS